MVFHRFNETRSPTVPENVFGIDKRWEMWYLMDMNLIEILKSNGRSNISNKVILSTPLTATKSTKIIWLLKQLRKKGPVVGEQHIIAQVSQTSPWGIFHDNSGSVNAVNCI